MSPARASRLVALVVALAGPVLLAGCARRASVLVPLSAPRLACRNPYGAEIACDPVSHDVLLSWVAEDSSGWHVWFSRSADRGATWSAPVRVSPPGESLVLDPESSPRMVCDGQGRIGLLWCSFPLPTHDPTEAGDLRFTRSLDGGRTWSDLVTVNEDGPNGGGRQSFQDLVVRDNGALYAAWLDSRPTAGAMNPATSDASIRFALSEDFGAHWGPNSAHGSRACASCRLGLAVDPMGGVFVCFRKRYAEQVCDVAVARADGPPVRMHHDDWKPVESPAAGPAVTISHDGTLRLAWFTGAPGRSGVWFRENVPEMMDSTSAPLAVLVARSLPTVHVGLGEAGMGGTVIACDADSTGANRLTLARVSPSGERVVERTVVPGTLGAAYPRVAAERVRPLAYVAWTQRVGDHRELRLARWDGGH